MCGRGEHQTQEQVVVAVKFQEEKQALINPNRDALARKGSLGCPKYI